MGSGTDIDALVSELRDLAGPGMPSVFSEAADALEHQRAIFVDEIKTLCGTLGRQQAVVEAAREVLDSPGNQRFLIALRNAFNALDARCPKRMDNGRRS